MRRASAVAFAALVAAGRSPYEIEGFVSERVDGSASSWLAPYDPFWPGYDPYWPARGRHRWPSRFGWGDPFWQPWPAYGSVRLPTGDMVRYVPS